MEIWPSEKAVWRYSPERHARNVAENRVWWGADGTNGTPAYKRFLSEVDAGVVPQTVWTWQEVGHTQDAAREQLELLPDDPFDTPKPSSLIERILEIATGPDDIVLDAFAGSGTTAHAVLSQNARDGGNRRFVLVEMEPAVAGPVTAERVRRVAEGYAFTGTARTELLQVKLTPTALRKMPATLDEVARLREENAERFDTFEEKVEKGAFVLRGVSNVAETKPGLGGGFRYARLGVPLVDADGRLNDAATADDVARLAFFAVAKEPLHGTPGHPLVGVHEGRAVYLLWTDAGGDGAASGGVLTRRTLTALPPHDGPRVVFGTSSRINAADLAALGVEFKQVPYDLPA